MTRRRKYILSICWSLLFVAGFGLNSYADLGVWDGKLHVVYHLSEPNKVNFVLNNIRNHLKGGGGADKLAIVLVVHGPALEEFERLNISDKVIENIAEIQSQGVELVACNNTLMAQRLVIEDLIGNFQIAKEGGVTRIAKLQSLGYLYLRP